MSYGEQRIAIGPRTTTASIVQMTTIAVASKHFISIKRFKRLTHDPE